MSLTEVLPHLKELSHTDKLLLLHLLVTEIVNESGLVPLDAQGKTANLGLHDSFEAAAVLAKALAETNMSNKWLIKSDLDSLATGEAYLQA